MVRTAEVRLEGYPDDVFTVQVSPVKVGAYLDFMVEWNQPATYAEMSGRLERFVELAHPEWTRNSEDLADAASFRDLDMPVTKAIVSEWIERVPEVPPPLPLASSATGPRPAPSAGTGDATPRRRSSRERKSSTR